AERFRNDGISSGQSGVAAARFVDPQNIAAVQLDYQLGILRASVLTSSYKSGVLDGLGAAYAVNREPHQLLGMAPSYDIFGAPLPSAVANSQIHYGTPQPIYIEDQPLMRGNFPATVAWASLRYGETKLLDDNFAVRDFGDTHSLVLLVDSLSVQDSLARMDPDIKRDTINAIFKAATNLKGELDGFQGKAEGELLENVIKGLGNVLGLSNAGGDWTKLKGNPAGATWFEVLQQGEYTGRDQLQKNIQLINEAIKSKNLEGKVTVQASGTSLASQARDDFGALLSLIHLSPVALTAKNSADRSTVADALKPGNADAHTAWTADKDMKPEDKAVGKQTYTDRWMQDRAAMAAAVGRYNTVNASVNWLPGL
ncbi:MAG: hypothetical protein ACOVOD_01755, partial [Rhodoferax sp.]